MNLQLHERVPHLSLAEDSQMSTDASYLIKSASIRCSTSLVFEGCSFDEQLIVTENSTVLWMSGGYKRLQASYPDEKVLHVGWAYFKGDDSTSSSPTVCVLHQGSLSLHTFDGRYHRVPLPEEFTRFSPLPTGIILMGGKQRGGIGVLVHPLEVLSQPKSFSGPSFAFGSEHIVWSSMDVPLLVTYDDAKERLALWKITVGEEEHVAIPSYTATTAVIPGMTSAQRTPLSVHHRHNHHSYNSPLHSSSMNAPSTTAKRLRLPDGSLSPLAFQPGSSSSAAPSNLSTVTPSKHIPCHVKLIAEHRMSRTSPPAEAHIAHDAQGREILCLFSPLSSTLSVFLVDEDYNRAGLQYTMESVSSMASLSITRQGKKDMLLLSSDGMLAVYVGEALVARVSSADGMIPLRGTSIAGGRRDGARDDASFLKLAPTNVIQKVSNIVALMDASGSRVTLVDDDGAMFRVSLGILPVDNGLKAVFQEFAGQLWREWGLDGDAWSGDNEREWNGLMSILLKKKSSSGGDQESDQGAWEKLVHSEHHRKHGSLFSLTVPPQNENVSYNILGASTNLQKHCIAVLHSQYEDKKMNVLEMASLARIRQILIKLSAAFAAKEYYDFYQNEANPLHDDISFSPSPPTVLDIRKLLDDARTLRPLPKDIWFAPGSRMQIIWTCFEAIRGGLMESLQDIASSTEVLATCAQHVHGCMKQHGWTEADIDTLPMDIAKLFRRCLRVCSNFEKLDESPSCTSLIEQEDDTNRPPSSHIEEDGMDGIDIELAAARFGGDCRLLEARRLLCSSKPIIIKGVDENESGDQSQQLQWKLLIMAMRTMALPLGRGAFALYTHRALPTEPLSIPELNLSAILPDRNNARFKFDFTTTNVAPSGGALAEITAWPEFHNGVAAGLRLVPTGNLTRTWIVYNSPSEPSYLHAGMLLGLGLTGHLGQLAITDLYRYLSQEHDPTLIGILIGMGAARRGSMDSSISKMLFLHLPTRHPAGYPEIEIAPLVQTAALIGLGLLYQGSCQKAIIDILVQEIARSPGVTPPSLQANGGQSDLLYHGVTSHCAAYALAAGIAVGLVTLGKGRDAFSAGDVSIEAQLSYLMLGGSKSGNVGKRTALFATLRKGHPVRDDEFQQQPFFNDQLHGLAGPHRMGDSSNRSTGVADELAAAQAAAQVIMEGELVNMSVTSPAASLALGLMYLQTNDERIAEIFCVPSSNFELEAVLPEHLTLRNMMRSLVMWDSIEPSEDWIRRQLPEILRMPLERIIRRKDSGGEDLQTIAQSHCYAIAGSCVALGIRYAGSQNRQAANTLRSFTTYFLEAKNLVSEPGSSQYVLINREVLESCVCNCVLGLSVVMSGSGDLATFQLLRALRKRMPVLNESNSVIPSIGHPPSSSFTYGSHSAISMALGFLFLGAGQFCFSDKLDAIAALVIALYPKLAYSTVDNRYYLQALRHLYALAIEPHTSNLDEFMEYKIGHGLQIFDLLDEDDDSAVVSAFFANLSFD